MSYVVHYIHIKQTEGMKMKRYKIKLTTCWYGIWREEIKIVSEADLMELSTPGHAIDILQVIK